MASVQERLQLKRIPLENWSISEQLYLASAVACSGDQNWMSVSRSLKVLCGHNRPSDWFSQKSCAAQYEMLLENVETPKRKKRNEKDTSQTIVETPIELIVRKLTQERIAELNKLLQEERDEYLKLKEEIGGIQNNRYEDNQLREMLAQIDAEEKQRERDKIKYNQWLKVSHSFNLNVTMLVKMFSSFFFFRNAKKESVKWRKHGVQIRICCIRVRYRAFIRQQ